ncbi:MAG: hypothetical protein M1831_001884 [Alyxoria varia]|nr:MAG: hypothetical protein M1831_001884 [Alyxoria varia]
MIGVFYKYGQNSFEASENIWEGVFGLLAAVIITAMGAVLLRVSKLQDKWRVKLAQALEAKETTRGLNPKRLRHLSEKYAMFILPFITVLREGLEAVVFIGGVGLGLPATAFPIPVLTGLGAGALIGVILYKGGNFASLQIFLTVSTCFLYLIAAGLFSKGVWYLEANTWNKAIGGDSDETGSGPGSYDITKSVWHVDCCNPEIDGGGGWGIFNSLFGWQNSATYGSVLSYNLYWIAIILYFAVTGYRESKGYWPFMKGSHQGSPQNDLGKTNGQSESEESHRNEKPGDIASVQEVQSQSS